MQKFVIVKHAAQKPKSMDIFETQVRMSGYLKKKRNKIGGWRKLWFVLQNQLLLSYSSREDYEKKLAPFKDVLNLVPGSIVRPASGSRFTIETTSNAIFTFRCGDSKTCADWIMALLESLALNNNPQSVIEKNLSFVMANKNLFNVARSCESLSTATASKKQHSNNLQSQTHPIVSRSTPKLVRLPISTSTKRLMQRGGYIDDCNYIKLDRDHFQMTGSNDDIDGVLGVQNFRLHHTALKHNHSTEVSRINRMFQNKSTVAAASTTNTTDTVDAGENNKPNHNQFFIMNRGDKTNVNNVNDSAMQENMKIISQIQQRLALRDEQKYRDNLLIDGQIYSNIEEQIQHLTLGDETDCDLERSFSEADILKFSKYNRHNEDDDDDDDDGGGGGDGKETEVIYAVIDLKDKHARRAKLKENTGRERPHSFTVPNNDYEEVNNISPELLKSFRDDNENIYEPVKGGRKGVNGNQTNPQKQTVWRYFPKIRLNFLGDSHKNHKQKETSDRLNGGPPSSCSSTSGTASATSTTTSSNASSSSSSFGDMKRRFGNHRRSIKIKMKKFYGRNSNNLSETNDNSNTSNNNNNHNSSNNNIDTPLIITNNSNDIDKKTKEKHNFFGSLPRMKKSRTTSCIVEQTTPELAENTNLLPKKHNNLPNLNGNTTVV